MLFGRKLKLIKKPDKNAEKKFREDIENEGGLEKKDMPAMIMSAYLVLFIPVLIIVGLLLLLFWFM
ncbi:MAG: hypothetical protein E7645_01275 [Ruminococcaceae bacterium]|nr:hypothetical protein [Oscillospiraceae bacterium]